MYFRQCYKMRHALEDPPARTTSALATAVPFLSAFASSTAAIHLRTCSRYLHRPLRLRRPCCLRLLRRLRRLRRNFTAGRP